MKKVYYLFLLTLVQSVSTLWAQQLPNSGFEDWSGAAFNGSIQLASWQASNVEQTYMGITARANMVTRITAAHGGQYAAYVKNTKVEVAGIGEVSPCWLTLGTPFSDITNGISGATAGTYGGIDWTYCPDTMQVWIKRTYGSVSSDESFSLVYYSWKGNSKATTYKAKNGSCVTIAEKINEESDIRQTNDRNACGTSQYATQVGEGWYHEKATYNDWTLIKVPITYFSDEAPEKVNVILSGGNYPNFRANSGIYEGNGLYVDDISLIYSSCAHEMYVGNKQFRGFSSDVYTYTYSVGNGVTAVPAIFLKRSGRRLSSQEVSIVNGQVDGAPTTITVHAQDGSSSTTYTVYFVSAASNNARLADIKVNGTSVPGFNAYLTSYQYALPYGTTEVPLVEATPQDAGASVVITQASTPSGLATVSVTAQDGVATQNYSLQFSVAQLADNTLQNILVDGAPVPGFVSSKSNYSISLPLGTTQAPQVTPVSAYPNGAQTISVVSNTLTDGCVITVSAPGTSATKTYRLTYKIEASTYSLLSALMLNGVALEGFSPEVTNYSLTLPLGTTEGPAISWTAGDAYQSISFVDGGLAGTSKVVVTAASGAQTVYRISFNVIKSSNCSLSNILVDGVGLADFHPDTLNYVLSLPTGTSVVPVVVATPGDAYQTVIVNTAGLVGTTRITVKAADGSARVYTISFEVQKSENAFLRMIYLSGDSLEGFDPTVLNYTVQVASAAAPVVSVDRESGQMVSISQPAGLGVASIMVTPEEGESNIYRITFVDSKAVVVPVIPADSILPSSDATLRGILLDGIEYADFVPSQFSYIDTLAWRSTAVPSVMPLASTNGQTITVEYGALDAVTRIHVLAEDGVTASTYEIAFPVVKSSNSALADLLIEDVDFTFNPSQTEYDIVLPCGTIILPAIQPEKAEAEQLVELSSYGVQQPTSIRVVAEDGSSTEYVLRFTVAESTLPNVLQNVAIEGYGLLDLTTTEDSVFTIDMPYGTRYLNIASYTKNFAEQTVIVEQGGDQSASIVRVSSNRAGETDKVYTFVANIPQRDPAYLTEISINGEPLAGFSPDVYNYVLSVADAPEVTFIAAEGSEAIVSSQNVKQISILVETDDYSHTYTLSFFYPADFTFSQTFEQWHPFTNPGTSKGNVGVVPDGWHTPLDAATTNDKGTYYPANAVDASIVHTEGEQSASLNTTWLTTSAESMPGVMSLSEQSVSVGAWVLGISALSSNTTLSFGDPIPFRNTPDKVALDYNLQSYNRVQGWHFMYQANRINQVNYNGAYSGMQKNVWHTMEQDIVYDEGFVPATLDIIVNSANSEAPATFYISSSSNRYTSKLFVDNLRFYYNSRLASVLVDSVEATISGDTILATLDAEYVGTPQLSFIGEVSDQGQQVVWQPWQGNTRTATITNYAEDGSASVYSLILTRPVSASTMAECTLQGSDLQIVRGSAYQTIDVQRADTGFVVIVTAENGSQQTYTVAVAEWIAAKDSVFLVLPTEKQPIAPSSGLLSEITIDDEIVEGFAADVFSYLAPKTGVYAAQRACVADSLVLLLKDTLAVWTVMDSAKNTNTYSLHFDLSNNTSLANIKLGENSLSGFDSQVKFYPVSVPEHVVPEPVLAEESQVLRTIEVNKGDTVYTYFYIVRAENGDTAQYCVQEFVCPLSDNAWLADFRLGGVSLSEFASDVTTYTMSQPAGYVLPDVSVVVAGTNAVATVSTDTQITPESTQINVSVLVTAENGNTQTYTLQVTVLPSAENHLDMIYLDATPLEDFDPETLSYEVFLPIGTSVLPQIDYQKADAEMTVVMDTTAISDFAAVAHFTCTAANGDVLVYTIDFSVLKSDNANLQMIYLDGEPLSGFDEDQRASYVHLSYGQPYPTVTYSIADSTATAHMYVSELTDSVAITVVAQDGVTEQVYTLVMDHLPSTNALLQMIYLDGDSLAGFDPEQEDYTLCLPYGTTSLPVVTYLCSDSQQVVVVGTENPTVITVTAGDGETIQEYSILYTYALSPNNYLRDLRANGVTVGGFSRDSLSYIFTYPVGSKTSDLLTPSDILAIPEDPDAAVTVSAEADGTLTVMVTAPNGDVRVYVIEQTILLSSNSLLRMIWLDGLEVKDFDPLTLTYTYLLPQGATVPELTAEAQDTLAEVFITSAGVGDTAYVYCDAEDGSETIYKVLLVYSDVNSAEQADVDDCVFLHVVGTDTYMAVTIRDNVQVSVCDHYGHRLYLADVPVVDPNYVRIETDSDGNQYIAEVYDGANGAVFKVPGYGKTYFAVFFRNGKKKVAKGTKFSLNY